MKDQKFTEIRISSSSLSSPESGTPSISHPEERQKMDHLQTVSAVIREITSLMELEILLPRVTRLIGEAFGYYGVLIFLKDEETDELVVETEYSLVSGENAPGTRLKAGQGINGWVVSHGQSLVVPDVSRDSRYYFHEGLPDTRSEMVVPIRKGNVIFGSLDLQSDRLNTFSDKDVLTAEILADQLAVAIENARLYQAQEHQMAYLKLMDDLTVSALAESDLDASLEHLVEAALKLVVADFGCIYLATEGDEESKAVVSPRNMPEGLDADEVLSSLRPLNEKIVSGGEPIRLSDQEAHEMGVQISSRPQDRISFMGVPLRDPDRIPIGALVLCNQKETGHFTHEDLEFLISLTDRTSLILAKARLDQRIRAEQAKLETIISSIADGVLVCDVDGNIILTNQATEKMLGDLSHIRTIEDLFLSVKPHDVNGAPLSTDNALMRIAMTTGRLRRRTVEITRAPQDRRILSVSSSPLIGLEGRITGAVAVLHDVTEDLDVRQKLENALVESQEGLDRLAGLYDTSRVLFSTLALQPSLETGLNYALDAIDADIGSLMLLDEETNTLVIRAHRGLPPEVASRMRLNLGEGIAGWVAQTGQPLLFDQRIQCDPRFKLVAARQDLQSAISVPLQSKDKVIGVLNASRTATLRPFTHRDLSFFSAVARQIGAAIENVNLYESLAGHIKHLSILNEASAALNRETDLNSILQVAAKCITSQLHFDRVGVFLVSEDSRYLERFVGTDDKGRVFYDDATVPSDGGRRTPLTPKGGSLAKAALEKRPFNIRDVATSTDLDPEETKALLSRGVTAVARIPLITGDKVLGVISVDNMITRRPISEDDIRLLMIFGNQVAVAIENAKSYLALQRWAEELQSLNDMKSNFIAMISHELRSPLHSIRGALSALLLQEQDRQSNRFTRMALKHTDNLGQLVENLLTRSRLERGIFKVEKIPLSLRSKIDEVVERFTETTAAGQRRFEVQVAPDLVVPADEEAITLILHNLIDNAIKYSPEESMIRITARESPEEILISVIDEGIGILEDQLSSIFDQFSRGRVPSGKRIRGVGLGLAICRSLVQAHGGRIWAESRTKEGSRFKFTLPV